MESVGGTFLLKYEALCIMYKRKCGNFV